jgi:hypothetical protein
MLKEYRGDVAAEVSSGQPDAYLDHIEEAYGDAFRSGTDDAAETFYLLYQQIAGLGNESSTELFLARFLPLLPKHARRKILNEVMVNPQSPRRND